MRIRENRKTKKLDKLESGKKNVLEREGEGERTLENHVATV